MMFYNVLFYLSYLLHIPSDLHIWKMMLIISPYQSFGLGGQKKKKGR